MNTMLNKHPATVLIMAGGTGGHVFPALAVARKLQQDNHKVEWLGTSAGIEADIVVKAGIPLHFISITGLRGKGRLALLLAPFRLLMALIQAIIILRKLRPCCALGMGGFASGPGGVAAWLLRIPLVIHEQNAIAGLTNRMLRPLSRKVFEAYPGAFGAGTKTTCIGNPLRQSVLGLPLPKTRFENRTGPLRILVMGGSLGASALNSVMPKTVEKLKGSIDLQIWHQVGHKQVQCTADAYADIKFEAKVVSFINDMDEAYSWADLVICRAGALTVSEIACVGVAAIFIPYPHAVDDHQTRNACLLETAKAAVIIPQDQLTADKLTDLLTGPFGDRKQLLNMANNARTTAYFDATDKLAEQCLEVSDA